MTAADERRARLGHDAVSAAQQVAATAPPWTDDKHRSLEALLRAADVTADGPAAQPEQMGRAS